MRSILLLCAGVLFAVSACEKRAETPAQPVAGLETPAVEPAATPQAPPDNPLPDPRDTAIADLPRAIIVSDELVTADIRFDESVFSFAPAIAMDVVDDARVRLEAMQEDASAYKAADPEYFRPYGLKIDWKVSAASGRLAGLEGFQYTYTGGAHGNYMTDGRIYDTLTGDRLRIGDLFKDPDAAATALADTVHRAIAEAKTARNSNPGSYAMFLGESEDAISVSDILAGQISLVPSAAEGKLGGFALHYAPYEIGSYAEGSYHIAIPQTAFHEFLKPEYADLFAGDPVPVARPDD